MATTSVESFLRGDHLPLWWGCEAPKCEFKGVGLLSISRPVVMVPSTLLPAWPWGALWKPFLCLSHFGTLISSLLTSSWSQPLAIRKGSSAEGGPQAGFGGGMGRGLWKVSKNS